MPLHKFLLRDDIIPTNMRIITDELINDIWIHLIYAIVNEIISRLNLRDHYYLAYRIADTLCNRSLINNMRDKIINVNWYEKQVFELALQSLISYPSDIPKTIYYYARSLFR